MILNYVSNWKFTWTIFKTIKNKNNNSYIYFKLQNLELYLTIAAYVYSIQSCLLHEIKFICACKSWYKNLIIW